MCAGWGGCLPSVFEGTLISFCQRGTYGHRDDDIVGTFLLECADTRGRIQVGGNLPKTLHGGLKVRSCANGIGTDD